MVDIVAEISGNHGGSLLKARELIFQAADAGCQYAKFQYYRPEDMPDCHRGDNYAMYSRLAVPEAWLPELFTTAKRSAIGLFASVFSVRAVHELLKYDVPYLKLASPKSTRLSKEIYEQIARAVPADVGLLASADEDDFEQMNFLNFFSPAMLYCPEGHPPTLSMVDFDYFHARHYYGFSDHTPGIRAPLAFIRAGAKMIEKHFKLDDDCVDAEFSANPETMHQLCRIANG